MKVYKFPKFKKGDTAYAHHSEGYFKVIVQDVFVTEDLNTYDVDASEYIDDLELIIPEYNLTMFKYEKPLYFMDMIDLKQKLRDNGWL